MFYKFGTFVANIGACVATRGVFVAVKFCGTFNICVRMHGVSTLIDNCFLRLFWVSCVVGSRDAHTSIPTIPDEIDVMDARTCVLIIIATC